MFIKDLFSWMSRHFFDEEMEIDHACNICEHVVYIVKGYDVRHLTQDELASKIRK